MSSKDLWAVKVKATFFTEITDYLSTNGEKIFNKTSKALNSLFKKISFLKIKSFEKIF